MESGRSIMDPGHRRARWRRRPAARTAVVLLMACGLALSGGALPGVHAKPAYAFVAPVFPPDPFSPGPGGSAPFPPDPCNPFADAPSFVFFFPGPGLERSPLACLPFAPFEEPPEEPLL